MGGVFQRVFVVVPCVMHRLVVMRMILVAFGAGRCLCRRGDGLNRCRIGLEGSYRGFGRGVILDAILGLLLDAILDVVFLGMTMFMRMIVVIKHNVPMVGCIGGMVIAIMGAGFVGVRAFMQALRLALIGLGGQRRIDRGVVDDVALDPFAMAAAAGVAVARTAAVTVGGAVLALFLGFAMGAFVGFDQRLPVGDRDLVIVGMDFAEGQEAVAVAAIFDEGRLQRRLYARDLGEVDIAAQLFALGGLEIKFFDAIAADHDDPGLFRVGGIDQHLVGHFGALDGGGRGARRAHIARPGDATVHLIRG
ncbi:hypothetical protein ACO2JO_10645 [Leptospira interrogans]